MEETNAYMDIPTRIIWSPPTKLNLIVKSCQILNKKVTVKYIFRDEYIHGKLVGLSKSKQFDEKTRYAQKYIGAHYLHQFFSSTKKSPLNGISF